MAYIISESMAFKMSAHQKAKINKEDNTKHLWEEFPYTDIGSVIGTTPLKKKQTVAIFSIYSR